MERDERFTNDHEAETGIRLQVMICAFGEDGIRRVAAGKHPRMAGVEYLVSWQTNGQCELPQELKRDDFRIISSDTKGLSVNRNSALYHATAPLLLISDDDTDYTEEGLTAVIKGFDAHHEADILAFKFESQSTHKNYPDFVFPLSSPPKGYYTSSIEIAFRKNPIKGKIWFNENFGVGAKFPSGEEEIFLKECLDAGLKGLFLPETIVVHDSTTTAARIMGSPSRPITKGAVFLRLHPNDWPIRMIAHALREIPLWRKGLVASPLSYCKNWLKGVKEAKRIGAFSTPYHSKQNPGHERNEQ